MPTLTLTRRWCSAMTCGSRQYRRDPFRVPHRTLGVFDLREHDNEFIAAVATYRVRAAHGCVEPSGQSLKHLVADRMSERVVNLFEAIDVDKEHRHLSAVTPCQRDRMFQTVGQQHSIGQIRERVVLREVREL